VIVPARRGRAFPLSEGECIKVVNTHGSQVVDAWALAPPDLMEHMSMPHTRAMLASLRMAVGDHLYRERRRPILTLVEDTSPGVHDMLFPACDPARYELLGHEGITTTVARTSMRRWRSSGFSAPPSRRR
jgi:uncharacterized protein YcgI (DUF1989 family)